MSPDRVWSWKIQSAVYLTEALLVYGILALAAGRAPELLLAPLTRVWVAAALPLPCHLLWLALHLWLGSRSAKPAVERSWAWASAPPRPAVARRSLAPVGIAPPRAVSADF